jgi:thiamine pyrophosphokinase
MPTCYLVGAGEFTARGFAPAAGDYVIAADAGYRALAAIGVKPDLLVGDFDSLPERPADVPCRVFPAEKDDTDLGLALKEGWARGYRTFVLYGAGGGRADHFFANLQLLGGLSRRGAQGRMVCESCDVYAVTDAVLPLPEKEKGTVVSVFCHGEQARGVTLSGLRYPLTRALLTCDHPLGVSNEFTGAQATVTVERGTLLVFVALAPENAK